MDHGGAFIGGDISLRDQAILTLRDLRGRRERFTLRTRQSGKIIKSAVHHLPLRLTEAVDYGKILALAGSCTGRFGITGLPETRICCFGPEIFWRFGV